MEARTYNLQPAAGGGRSIHVELSNYDAWVGGSFADSNLKNYLQNTVQPNMMSAVQGLFLGSYYATNGLPFP